MQSLKEVYCGIFPKTFEGTFALMHIVYTCAKFYYKEQEREFWHTLFLHMRQWQCVIATYDDARLFRETASLLWPVPESDMAEAAGHFDDSLLQLPQSQPETIFELPWTSSSCFNYPQQSTTQVSLPSTEPSFVEVGLYHQLREGQVITICRRYFSGKLLLEIKNPRFITN